MYNKIKAINDAGTKIIDYMNDGYTRKEIYERQIYKIKNI